MFSKKYRLLTKTMLGLTLALFLVVPCAQAEVKALSKDTKLHPQGWTVGDQLEFKKGTPVLTNGLGEVISGTLTKNAFLQPRGWERVINDYYFVSAYSDTFYPRFRRAFFMDRRYNMAIPGYGHLLYKGGTPLTFSESGDILSGTIAKEATIRLQEGAYGFLTFKENTILSFYDSGAVRSGVLDEDTLLRPVGWKENFDTADSAGFVKFSAKKTIEFNEQGEVIAGTLKEKTKWRAAGEPIELPANAQVRFDEQGAAVEKNEG